MNGYLLDANVLIALFDPNHVNHNAAHGWFAKFKEDGWATCPLTENALIRILSHPNYPSVSIRPKQVAELLDKFCQEPDHQFWPDSLSLRDSLRFDLGLTRSNQQLTDAYLVGLAVKNSGKLVTFDRGINPGVARTDAATSLELVPA